LTKQQIFRAKIQAEGPSHTTVIIALLGFTAYKFTSRNGELKRWLSEVSYNTASVYKCCCRKSLWLLHSYRFHNHGLRLSNFV